MDSYARTIAALRRQQPDRVPIFCFKDETSSGTSRRFRDFVSSHADVFYSRILYTGFQCTGLEPAQTVRDAGDGWLETIYDLGDGISFREVHKKGETGDYIGYRKHLASGPSDIERILDLPYVRPRDNPSLTAWIEEINSLGAAKSAEGAFFRIAFLGPLGTLAGAISPGDFALLAMDHESIIRRYLDITVERQEEYLAHALERLRVRAIVNIGGAEYAIPPLMSPVAFREYIEPYDGRLIRVTHEHGALMYYHSHGKIRAFIPSFIAMGADGLHPLEPPGTTGDCDLAEVKRLFGRDICLVGNIQYDGLARLERPQVEWIVRDAVLTAKEGGGFILSPSCTPYHNPMPRQVEENIMAFIEAGLRYGGY